MKEKWLPEGKKAALCFSIDDIHPATSKDYYDAGGDLDKGVLGLLHWLLKRHPQLKVTLFVTPDWRLTNPFLTRKLLSAIPYLRDRVFLTKVLKKGTMRLDKHLEFVDYIKNLPNTEIAMHGLYHCHKGLRPNVEFQNQTTDEFLELLQESKKIFANVKINLSKGICPPNWEAPINLQRAMVAEGLKYLASARDIFTEISRDAVANMSGMKGVSLIYPQFIFDNQLVHIPANFNATRTIDRAFSIIENNGLISIKAHIMKNFFRHILYDGIDEVYINYLDTLLTVLENKYGDELWMTSMNEISEYVFNKK
ncbi:MAG TPA: DUF2334 domain-containing protein [Paludibacteraceae bacterium]|jgi:predicted deacetylase|nr:DUF2334 domain-containing protein [Paludibacteraceae bacterium]